MIREGAVWLFLYRILPSRSCTIMGKVNRSILLSLGKYAGIFKGRGCFGRWKKNKGGEASWGIISGFNSKGVTRFRQEVIGIVPSQEQKKKFSIRFVL